MPFPAGIGDYGGFRYGDKMTYSAGVNAEQTIGTVLNSGYYIALSNLSTAQKRIEVVRFNLRAVGGSGGRISLVSYYQSSQAAGANAISAVAHDLGDPAATGTVSWSATLSTVPTTLFFNTEINPGSDGVYQWSMADLGSGRPLVLRAGTTDALTIQIQVLSALTTSPAFLWDLTWTEE